jgi:hypothetical protein
MRKKNAPPSKRQKKRNPPRQLLPKHKRERLKPISLWPLTFDQALDGLIAVKPRQKATK